MSILDELSHFNIEQVLREHFNLSVNPFTPQELFYEGISEQEAQRHSAIFQNRRELLQNLLTTIRGQRSCKAVLYGHRGVGKSSLLNLILYHLSRDKYLTLKISVGRDDINTEILHKKILRELSSSLIASMAEASGWKAIQTKIQRFFKRADLDRLKAISSLSFLFSGDQISFEETTGEKAGETIRLGPQFLGLSFSSEQIRSAKSLISYAQIPAKDFQRILASAYDLIQIFDYRGIVLAIDDADKLDDTHLELALLGLLRDAFYPEARYHLLVACARDIEEARSRNMFTYHSVETMDRSHVMATLAALYESAALSPCHITDYFDQDCLEEIYTSTHGLLREAILACQQALTRACIEGKKCVDLNTFREIQLSDDVRATIALLERQSTEGGILNYLLHQGETYASDPELQRLTEVSQPRLSQVLKELEAKRLLACRRRGKRMIYTLRPGVDRLMEG